MQNVYNSFKKNNHRLQVVLVVANLWLFVQLIASLWFTGFSSLSLLCIFLWLPAVTYYLYFVSTAAAELKTTLESKTPEYRNRFDKDFGKICPLIGGGITEDYVVSTCWNNRISLGLISNIVRAYSGFDPEAMAVIQQKKERFISPNIFIFFNDNTCIKIKVGWKQRHASDLFIQKLLERNPKIKTEALPEDRVHVLSYNTAKQFMWTLGIIAYIILITFLVIFIPL